MAITFTGTRVFKTSPCPHMFYGQDVASQSFKLRIDAATPNSIHDGLNVFSRDLFDFQHAFLHGPTTTVDFRTQINLASVGSVLHDFPLTIGVVYVVCVEYNGTTGTQTTYINGVPTVMGHLVGTMPNRPDPIQMGPQLTNTAITFTLGDYNAWDGYGLTSADAAALTSNGDPTTIGTSASWRCHWTLAGTTGQPAAIGDAGLKNAYGGGGADGSDFATVAGTGTAVYADPLVWAPTVTPHPYVAGALGKNIGLTFTSNHDGSLVIPSQLLTTPTIKVNGVDQGALVKSCGGHTTKVHQCMFFSTPGTPPIQIGSGDTVELTAPAAWANTPAGSVAALAGTIDNRVGRSSVGVDTMTKTLRMGVNNAPPGGIEYYPFKNAKYKTNISAAVGHGFEIINQPCEAGLVLIVWDATKPLTPAILSLRSNAPALVTVTHHPEYDVSPSDGIGYQRVYEIAYVPGSLYETKTGGSSVGLNIDDLAYTGGPPNWTNYWCYLAGEWSLVDGVPVFDRSDQFALSNIYLDRLPDNLGSMRAVDTTACSGALYSFPDPEILPSRNDPHFWAYDSTPNPFTGNFGFTSLEPVDVTATPWLYSSQFRNPGNSYTATLTDTITTAPAVGTREVWHFSDGATAPLMARLELKIDNEEVRILFGSGTTWTVYRGSNGTTPATHAPGPVTVFGRISVLNRVKPGGTAGSSSCVLLRTDKPHGMITRNGYFPVMNVTWTATDGTVVKGFSPGGAYVTGPDSFIAIWSGYFGDNHQDLKPNGVYPLDPTKSYNQSLYFGGMPIDVYCEMVARFPHANLHINVPIDACNDMVWTYARICRDHFPSGRKIYVEYANEPWNYNYPFQANLYCHEFGGLALPSALKGGYDLAYYVYRATQVHAIFRSVFTAASRASEIVGGINCQMGSGSSQVTPSLELGLSLGQPFDAVMIAPYYSMCVTGNGLAATVAAFNQYDDDQAAEQLLHDLTYDTTGIKALSQNVANAVKAYNAAHGKNCILMGYEGGIEYAAPTGAVNYESRSHDIQYNPGFYDVEQGWFKMLQDVGFDHLHIYAMGIGWPASWGIYHMRTQKHSRGDGQGGAADNRALTITAGSPGYIGASSLRQDRRADSVRGQALIDWLNAIDAVGATAYTLSTPTPDSGPINVASGLFIVQPNGTYTGTITITPSGGGLSTPIVLTFAGSSTAQTFSITPTIAGTVTLATGNSGSLANPSAVTYTATAPPPPPAPSFVPTEWLNAWFGRWF